MAPDLQFKDILYIRILVVANTVFCKLEVNKVVCKSKCEVSKVFSNKTNGFAVVQVTSCVTNPSTLWNGVFASQQTICASCGVLTVRYDNKKGRAFRFVNLVRATWTVLEFCVVFLTHQSGLKSLGTCLWSTTSSQNPNVQNVLKSACC